MFKKIKLSLFNENPNILIGAVPYSLCSYQTASLVSFLDFYLGNRFLNFKLIYAELSICYFVLLKYLF